jgi:plastocyanin
MRNRPIRFALALVAVAALGGSAMAGSITGTVKYDGPIPGSAKRPLKMDADPGCAKKHSSEVMPEFLVLGDGQTLGNVFVRVKSGVPQKDYPVPSEPVVLDQHGCLYVPHVAGLMVGQTFKVLNSDGLLHNIHALPEVNKGFNRAMPANVKEAEFTFDKEEFMFKIKCDVHPWMGAYVGVLSHPYFDVTGEDGKYRIGDLPAGTYEVEVWHEKLKTQTASVTISGDETKTADFTFTPPPRN